MAEKNASVVAVGEFQDDCAVFALDERALVARFTAHQADNVLFNDGFRDFLSSGIESQ